MIAVFVKYKMLFIKCAITAQLNQKEVNYAVKIFILCLQLLGE